MLTHVELLVIARERLSDAVSLLDAERYDGAAYICGYAFELALKAKACKLLRWNLPEGEKGWAHQKQLKTHDLDILMMHTGKYDQLQDKFKKEISTIKTLWNPANRYAKPGNLTKTDAQKMIASARKLLRALR